MVGLAAVAPAAVAPGPVMPGAVPAVLVAAAPQIEIAAWATEAEGELRKIPFFVRGKARRNTERFAIERGIALITVETLYDAKAHFGR